MANGDHGDWLTIASEVVKYVLAAVGAIASSAVLWMTARFRGHVAMLLRHEKELEESQKELGLNRAFRETAHKGPIGEELAEAVKDLKRRDQRLSLRIDAEREQREETGRTIVSMETDIKWIREALERMTGK